MAARLPRSPRAGRSGSGAPSGQRREAPSRPLPGSRCGWVGSSAAAHAASPCADRPATPGRAHRDLAGHAPAASAAARRLPLVLGGGAEPACGRGTAAAWPPVPDRPPRYRSQPAGCRPFMTDSCFLLVGSRDRFPCPRPSRSPVTDRRSAGPRPSMARSAWVRGAVTEALSGGRGGGTPPSRPGPPAPTPPGAGRSRRPRVLPRACCGPGTSATV